MTTKTLDSTGKEIPAPTVIRRDISDWMWDMFTSPLQRTHDGFLQGRAAVTNIGVFPYPQADGTVRFELRHPDEVFDPESIKTLDGKPLTNDHPLEGVKPTTSKNLQVGSISAPGADPYRVYANVSITDADAIKDVDAGKCALSCGYTCELDASPGTWMGVAYTHIQRKIRYNHVALVDKGRAGDDAILRKDGVTSFQNTTPSKGVHMRKIRLGNGVEAEADEFVIQALDAAKDKAKKAEKDKEEAEKESKDAKACSDASKKELDKAKGELDAAKEKVKDLESKMKEKDEEDKKGDKFDAAVTSRIALLTSARALGVECKDSDSELAIKTAVVKTASPSANLDGVSPEYIGGRFDGAVELLQGRVASAGSRQMGDFPRADAGVSGDLTQALEKARNDASTHLYGAWDKTQGGKA